MALDVQSMPTAPPNPFIRDMRVLMRIVLAVVFYWTVGLVVRFRYRRCQRRNEKVWVDASKRRGLWEWNRREDIE